jgi:hypothetical protein
MKRNSKVMSDKFDVEEIYTQNNMHRNGSPVTTNTTKTLVCQCINNIEISGSHGSKYENDSFLGISAV